MSEQEPNKSNARVFIEGVFKAEEESAASLGTHKLNKYADIAMYHASISQKDRIVFYEPSMEAKLKRQMEVERIIKKARS